MVLNPFVFLPLYLYPYNTSSWSSITSSIADHPDLSFHVVVAPNLANVLPDKNYQVALDALNNFTNVVTLGYVATAWTTRDISNVMSDITSYASWSNYNASNIAVGGIFFDEVASIATDDTISYMKNITNFAKNLLGPGKQHVSFNPGVAIDPVFYDMADTINIFENAWSEFNITQVGMLPWDMLANSTFVIHNFTGDEYTQSDLVSNLTEANVSGLFITTQDSYNELSTLWPEFCDAMEDEIDSGDLDDSDDSDERSISRRHLGAKYVIKHTFRVMRRWIW